MDNKVVQQILEKQEQFLYRHFLLSSAVIKNLYRAGVITYMTKEALQRRPSSQQLPLLLEVLKLHSTDVLWIFLKVLQVNFDRWIADVLLDTKITYSSEVPILEDMTLREYLKSKQVQREALTHKKSNRDRLTSSLGRRHLIHHQCVKQRPPEKYVYFRTTNRRHNRHQPTSEFYEFESPEVAASSIPHINSKIVNASYQVNHLQSVFDIQRKNNNKTLSVLKQEQSAITELLTKNLEEQDQLQKNQQTITDIRRRLDLIQIEAVQLLRQEPTRKTTQSRLSRVRNVIPSEGYR